MKKHSMVRLYISIGIALVFTFSICLINIGLVYLNTVNGHPFFCLMFMILLYLNGRWFWDKVQFLRFVILMERARKQFMKSFEKFMVVTFKDLEVRMTKEPIEESRD